MNDEEKNSDLEKLAFLAIKNKSLLLSIHLFKTVYERIKNGDIKKNFASYLEYLLTENIISVKTLPYVILKYNNDNMYKTYTPPSEIFNNNITNPLLSAENESSSEKKQQPDNLKTYKDSNKSDINVVIVGSEDDNLQKDDKNKNEKIENDSVNKTQLDEIGTNKGTTTTLEVNPIINNTEKEENIPILEITLSKSIMDEVEKIDKRREKIEANLELIEKEKVDMKNIQNEFEKENFKLEIIADFELKLTEELETLKKELIFNEDLLNQIINKSNMEINSLEKNLNKLAIEENLITKQIQELQDDKNNKTDRISENKNKQLELVVKQSKQNDLLKTQWLRLKELQEKKIIDKELLLKDIGNKLEILNIIKEKFNIETEIIDTYSKESLLNSNDSSDKDDKINLIEKNLNDLIEEENLILRQIQDLKNVNDHKEERIVQNKKKQLELLEKQKAQNALLKTQSLRLKLLREKKIVLDKKSNLENIVSKKEKKELEHLSLIEEQNNTEAKIVDIKSKESSLLTKINELSHDLFDKKDNISIVENQIHQYELLLDEKKEKLSNTYLKLQQQQQNKLLTKKKDNVVNLREKILKNQIALEKIVSSESNLQKQKEEIDKQLNNENKTFEKIIDDLSNKKSSLYSETEKFAKLNRELIENNKKQENLIDNKNEIELLINKKLLELKEIKEKKLLNAKLNFENKNNISTEIINEIQTKQLELIKQNQLETKIDIQIFNTLVNENKISNKKREISEDLLIKAKEKELIEDRLLYINNSLKQKREKIEKLNIQLQNKTKEIIDFEETIKKRKNTTSTDLFELNVDLKKIPNDDYKLKNNRLKIEIESQKDKLTRMINESKRKRAKLLSEKRNNDIKIKNVKNNVQKLKKSQKIKENELKTTRIEKNKLDEKIEFLKIVKNESSSSSSSSSNREDVYNENKILAKEIIEFEILKNKDYRESDNDDCAKLWNLSKKFEDNIVIGPLKKFETINYVVLNSNWFGYLKNKLITIFKQNDKNSFGGKNNIIQNSYKKNILSTFNSWSRVNYIELELITSILIFKESIDNMFKNWKSDNVKKRFFIYSWLKIMSQFIEYITIWEKLTIKTGKDKMFNEIEFLWVNLGPGKSEDLYTNKPIKKDESKTNIFNGIKYLLFLINNIFNEEFQRFWIEFTNFNDEENEKSNTISSTFFKSPDAKSDEIKIHIKRGVLFDYNEIESLKKYITNDSIHWKNDKLLYYNGFNQTKYTLNDVKENEVRKSIKIYSQIVNLMINSINFEIFIQNLKKYQLDNNLNFSNKIIISPLYYLNMNYEEYVLLDEDKDSVNSFDIDKINSITERRFNNYKEKLTKLLSIQYLKTELCKYGLFNFLPSTSNTKSSSPSSSPADTSFPLYFTKEKVNDFTILNLLTQNFEKLKDLLKEKENLDIKLKDLTLNEYKSNKKQIDEIKNSYEEYTSETLKKLTTTKDTIINTIENILEQIKHYNFVKNLIKIQYQLIKEQGIDIEYLMTVNLNYIFDFLESISFKKEVTNIMNYKLLEEDYGEEKKKQKILYFKELLLTLPNQIQINNKSETLFDLNCKDCNKFISSPISMGRDGFRNLFVDRFSLKTYCKECSDKKID